MTYNFKAEKLSDLKNIASDIVSVIEKNKLNIILFTGEMGAGKTTFIKELCNTMGVTDNVTSPTFALINEYSTKNGDTIYHFDIYRIDSIDEVIDLGYEEYVYSGNICFIEWWQKMEQLIPQVGEPGVNVAELEIKVLSTTSREINLKLR